ncbi:hypothetical protein ILUMI_08677 [Ignelater luminosus]|uniref:Uncharacterized protein n=1 Tax=Ignelater luminosus TaxID=2038154 RepID=A0A8K0D5T9_IGNLU|nr:hypothetical protein ILUMI_08677 [Ignelater luminosus]
MKFYKLTEKDQQELSNEKDNLEIDNFAIGAIINKERQQRIRTLSKKRKIANIKANGYLKVTERRELGLRDRGIKWKLGVWNTRSINGKENELVYEFNKEELDILVISGRSRMPDPPKTRR